MASAQAYDIPHAVLSASEVQKKWPHLVLPDTFVAGLEKAAGIVFPELSIKTFLAEAEAAGADLAFDEPVKGGPKTRAMCRFTRRAVRMKPVGCS